jgi:predicted nucleic acid-binding protein
MIVVDTSVLIDLLKGKATDSVGKLVNLEKHDTPYHIPAICCQELLHGARNEREWKQLQAYLSTQNLLAPADSWQTHQAAARIYFDCRRKGITLRGSIDCLIAQLVLDNDAVLLHDDDDFTRIAKVRPLGFV